VALRIDADTGTLNKEIEGKKGPEETEKEPVFIKKFKVDYFKHAFIVVKGEWAAGPFSTWEDAERYLKLILLRWPLRRLQGQRPQGGEMK
jgi:hypothetical protein